MRRERRRRACKQRVSWTLVSKRCHGERSFLLRTKAQKNGLVEEGKPEVGVEFSYNGSGLLWPG